MQNDEGDTDDQRTQHRSHTKARLKMIGQGEREMRTVSERKESEREFDSGLEK